MVLKERLKLYTCKSDRTFSLIESMRTCEKREDEEKEKSFEILFSFKLSWGGGTLSASWEVGATPLIRNA